MIALTTHPAQQATSLPNAVSASWITHPDWVDPAENTFRTPLVATTIDIAHPLASAQLSLSGLGVWVATIDDRPITDAVLEPGMSEFRVRVALTTVDVTEQLPVGAHQLLIQLGEGSAHVRDVPGRYTKFAEQRLAPRALAQLDLVYADGTEETIRSDRSWRTALGATTFSHWYGGEDYDARLVPTRWVDAVEVAESQTGPLLWTRSAPPVKVVDTLNPTIRSLTADNFVCDFGVNHAGRPVISVTEAMASGARIELWPGEHLDSAGHVDQSSSGGPVFDTFITAGGASSWHPQFCYHGYRYLEVKIIGATMPGDGIEIESQQVMTANQRTGEFSCSDPILSQVFSLVDRAVQSNLLSVPTDCPHREKLGWLEETHLVFGPVAHLYDIESHFADTITHLVDAQRPNGMLPSIAPELVVFEGGFLHDINWGGAIWRLPEHLWRTYGSLDAAREAWEPGLRYLAYIESLEKDGLLHDGLADWITLDQSTPPALVHGHGHLAMLEAAASLATALGHQAAPFEEKAVRVRQRLHDSYAAGQQIGSGSQASLALALDARIISAEHEKTALQQLIDVLERDDYAISVGEIALPALFRVLSAAGRHDILYRVVTQSDHPGYAAMLALGFTALGEAWVDYPNICSANHFMLGYVSAWLSEDIAGLKQAPNTNGWRDVVIAPHGINLVDSAGTSYHSRSGHYQVRWERSDDQAAVSVQVPADGQGTFLCPPGWTLDNHQTRLALGPGEQQLLLIRT